MLLIYTTIADLDVITSRLLYNLQSRDVKCAISVRRTGDIASSAKKRKPFVPPGTIVITIELLNAFRTKSHIQRLGTYLDTVLNECAANGILDGRTCLHKRLEFRTSNGADDSEWFRVFFFDERFLFILAEYDVGLKVDVMPPMFFNI